MRNEVEKSIFSKNQKNWFSKKKTKKITPKYYQNFKPKMNKIVQFLKIFNLFFTEVSFFSGMTTLNFTPKRSFFSLNFNLHFITKVRKSKHLRIESPWNAMGNQTWHTPVFVWNFTYFRLKTSRRCDGWGNEVTHDVDVPGLCWKFGIEGDKVSST